MLLSIIGALLSEEVVRPLAVENTENNQPSAVKDRCKDNQCKFKIPHREIFEKVLVVEFKVSKEEIAKAKEKDGGMKELLENKKYIDKLKISMDKEIRKKPR